MNRLDETYPTFKYNTDKFTYNQLLNMNGMSNFDLLKLSKQIGLKLNGVMMRDQIDTLKPGCYIFNIQASYQGNGTHWVGFYISPKNELLYCDSYGVPPFQDLVNKFSNKTIYYNNVQFQNFSSDECGLFSILFLYCVEGTSGKKLIRNFDNFLEYFIVNKKKLYKNDKIILEIFKELID